MKVLISLLLSVALLSPVTHAATLKIATIAPDGTFWMKSMRKAASEIKQATDGRVKIKFFPGGVQGSDQSVLRKMRIRQLQGGAVSNGIFTSIAPATQLYSLPFTFESLEELKAVRSEFDQYIIDELADKGYIMLGMSEAGFAYMMSSKPIRSSTDMLQRKVWSPEGDIVSQLTFENGGVEPILLPLSDVYTSLQTGLIDTIAVNPSTSIALQWHTKLNYATDYPLVFLMGMLVVDARAFNKLTDEDQVIVRDIMGKTFAKMSEQNAKDDIGARAALEQNGMQFLQLSAEDKVQWRSIADSALTALAEKGVYPVEVFERLQDRLKQIRLQQ